MTQLDLIKEAVCQKPDAPLLWGGLIESLFDFLALIFSEVSDS